MSLLLWNVIYEGSAGMCWVTLLFAWLIGILVDVCGKTSDQKCLGYASIRLILAWVLLLVLLVTMFLFTLHPIVQLVSFDILWLRHPGLLLLFTATVFTLWARLVLGSMWSSTPRIKSDHLLRINGPYRITRHPIYTGLLGMVIGSLLMLASSQWFLTAI